jgi:NAD(P)-dependent dehydrogenase (short-subunit alcohol dehydrogenase family)
VNLSSSGYRIAPFRPDDINFGDGKTYHPLSGYGQSKTANILFSKGLAKRGVTSFAVHPGLILTTHLSDEMDITVFGAIDEVTEANTGRRFGAMDRPKTIEQGDATTIVAAFDPTIADQSGGYLADSVVVDVLDHAKDEVMVEKLWEISEKLAGERFTV